MLQVYRPAGSPRAPPGRRPARAGSAAGRRSRYSPGRDIARNPLWAVGRRGYRSPPTWRRRRGCRTRGLEARPARTIRCATAPGHTSGRRYQSASRSWRNGGTHRTRSATPSCPRGLEGQPGRARRPAGSPHHDEFGASVPYCAETAQRRGRRPLRAWIRPTKSNTGRSVGRPSRARRRPVSGENSVWSTPGRDGPRPGRPSASRSMSAARSRGGDDEHVGAAHDGLDPAAFLGSSRIPARPSCGPGLWKVATSGTSTRA